MFDPAPFPAITFNTHLFLGSIGLVGAVIALLSRKGSKPHLFAGRTMVIAMTISAISALLFMFQKFSAPPIINSVTALYGLVTAVLALQPTSSNVKRLEIVSSTILLLVFIWFLTIAIPNVLSGDLFIGAPLSLLVVGAIFLIGDLHYFNHYQSRHKIRIRRHMVRIIWSLAILIRAPLFELKDVLGLPLPVVLVAPLLTALLLTMVFWKRASQ